MVYLYNMISIKMSDEYGNIYCFSNPSMPGIVKIGMTMRTPEERAKELYTTGVALPFKIEFAKKVNNPSQKERELHILLEDYYERPNSRREFFHVSPEKVHKFFNIIDGEMWVETSVEEDEPRPPIAKGCRDMAKCFITGQRIRHSCRKTDTEPWIGIYDSSKNGIIYDGTLYTSISTFASNHYVVERPDRTSQVNGWDECECELDGNWISTFNLPG